MSILGLALDLQMPQFEHLPAPEPTELAYVETPHKENPVAVATAMQATNKGMQAVLVLEKLVNDRGRNSDNAKACRGVIQDYFMGLDDLRRTLADAKAGDASATEKIPGILAALQESFNPEALLSKMTTYANKNTKEKALPHYVYEVVKTLGGVIDGISMEMQGISAVLDVQLQVRASVTSALEKYKFHGVQEAPVATMVMDEAPMHMVQPEILPVNLNVSASEPVLEETPFNKEEIAWFDSPVVANTAPAQASRGFLGRMKDTLGGLLSSLTRSVPRAALAGAILSVGCGGEEAAPASTPLTFISAPGVAAPVAPVMPAAPKFQVAEDAPNLWKGISNEIAAECGLSGNALQRETGNLVRESFAAQEAGYKTLVQGMSAERQAAAKAHLSSNYRLSFADTEEGVFKSTLQTGNLGAVNMQNGETMQNGERGEITLWGNAAFADYSCPTK